MFFVKVRCLTCDQVVDAEPTRKGTLMWQHKLAGGLEDCPAWKEGKNHEPVHAHEQRVKHELERATRVPSRGAQHHNPGTPDWKKRERSNDARAEQAAPHRLDDEYSGDWRARRPRRAPSHP